MAPPGPSTTVGLLACLTVLIVVLAAGTFLTIHRQAGVPATNSIWAEDGSVYLSQAAVLGPWRTIWAPVGGYLTLWPRLLASMTVQLSTPAAAATWVAVSAAASTTACGLVVYVASAGHLRSRTLRGVLAVAVVLPTVGNGQVANDWNNLHAYFLVAALWVLLWRPRSRGGRIFATAISLLATLSAGTALLLAPLVGTRLVTVRNWREQGQAGAWILGAALQVWAILLGSKGTSHLHLPLLGPLIRSWLVTVGLGGFVGPVLASHGWHLAGWLAPGLGTLVLVMLAMATALFQGRHRVLIPAMVIASAAWYVVVYLLRAEPLYDLGRVNVALGLRHAAVPTWFVVSALVLAADRLGGRRRHRGRHSRAPSPAWGITGLAVCCLVIASVVTSYPANANRRGQGPPWRETVVAAARSCASGHGQPAGTQEPAAAADALPVKAGTSVILVPISPVTSPARWYMYIPCRGGTLAW